MDKNSFTGMFLILIILAGSFYIFKPTEAEINQEKARIEADSLKNIQTAQTALTDTAKAITQIDSALLAGPFGNAIAGTASTYTLENELIKVTFSNKGGKIINTELKQEKNYKGNTVQMLDNKGSFGINFVANGKAINTNELYFTPTVNGNAIQFRADYGAGQYVEFLYTLLPGSNNVDFNISLIGLNQIIAANTIGLNWEAKLFQQEKSLKNERGYSSTYFKYEGENPDYLNLYDNDAQALDEGKVEWIAFKQHFFSAILIPKTGFQKGSMAVKLPTDSNTVKEYTANMELAFNKTAVQNYDMRFYFGSNKYTSLKEQGQEIEKLVDMGYWPLKYINRFVVLPLFNWLEGLNLGYGLIILMLTILVKGALSPLTYKSYLSMAKMRVLKPEMDEIKEKVGDDNPTLLQQEYLKLYKQVGVNPLGGCLPMLLQMPFIMAFFFFFPNLFELRGQSFLWMDDLSTYDSFFTFGFNIPFIGNHISLMCLLMTISQLIQAYYNNLTAGSATNNQMKYIGYIMPIVFFGILNSYPSGLNYYYFLANMITFGMQFAIRAMVDDEKIHAILAEKKARPVEKKKKSKFQQRMDEYMKQQQLQRNKK